MKPLKQLLRSFVDKLPDISISGLAIDSRKVRPGDCFIAYPGVMTDGRHYIPEAVKRGAAVVVLEKEGADAFACEVPTVPIEGLAEKVGFIADRFFLSPSIELSLSAFTGTNGKTSSSHFLAQGYELLGIKAGVLGTLGNGRYGHLTPSPLTTLDPIELQRLLSELKRKRVLHIAMEASSHALDQGRINGVAIKTAYFSNLSHDHLDYHGTLENYGAAKMRLFDFPTLQHIVINRDDRFSEAISAHVGNRVPITTYSMQPKSGADYTVESYRQLPDGIEFKLKTPRGVLAGTTPLMGAFNLYNIFPIVIELENLGIPEDAIRGVLEKLHPVTGRMQRFQKVNSPTVIVDYAHTPDALENALKALRAHANAKLWCVFGCGGDRDKAKRPLMGAISERYADRVVVCDDNPRGEASEAIIQDITASIKSETKLHIEPKRAKAISYAIDHAEPSDLILVAGKGHEDYQIYGENREHFSDIEYVSKLYI